MQCFLARSTALARCGGLICRGLSLCVLIALFYTCAVFPAASQEAPTGLSKDQVIKLLKEDPTSRVQYLVNKYGIAFFFAQDTENELRDAGATTDLLDLIRKLAPQKPAEVKPPPPPTLVINAKPGEASVYVDDELRGQTGTDGGLKLGNLASGSHKLRISLVGFHSFEVNLELTAGQTNTVVAELHPIPPPPTPSKEETPPKETDKSAPAADKKLPTDPNDPLTPHAPGIYYVQEAASAHRLIELEEAPPASRAPQTGRGSSMGALGGFGGFGGPKWKSLIFGSKAHVRVPPGRPVFFFYFPTVEADASTYGLANDAFRHTSTPNGFVLVHLQTQKNTREIPAKGSVTASVDEKDTVSFEYEKTAPGVYKVQLRNDLGPGEYGFLYGGMLQAMAQTWLFDFGVDKSK
jgi:hypothetical protein